MVKVFGSAPPRVDFYVSTHDEDHINVVSESNTGAGKSRFRVIKSVNELNHQHELAHVFALEFGFVHPFVDEGIATALGSRPFIASQDSCKEMTLVMKQGLPFYLASGNFSQAHSEKMNVYALAQWTMNYWIKRFGMQKIQTILLKGQDNPDGIVGVIENTLEPLSKTEKVVYSQIHEACRGLKLRDKELRQ
jgi:hypothetical protein